MKTPYLVLFSFFFSSVMFGQYTDHNGEFLKEQTIKELKQFPPNSKEQNLLQDLIIQSLVRDMDIRNGRNSMKDREKLLRHITDISLETGDFTFLNEGMYRCMDEKESYQRVINIEDEIRLLEDSVYRLHGQLMKIALDEKVPRVTKEKAVRVLAESNDFDVIRFIFENEHLLRFTPYDIDEVGETWGRERTGMSALVNNKFSNRSEMDNWVLLGFLIEYWGKESYSDKVMSNMSSGSQLEFVLIHNRLVHKYQKPELIFEFIRANAENKDTELLKKLSSYYPDSE